jgi:hypothetical protein
VTEDDFRRLALALPGAVEGAHMGHPDFRADGRIFATIPRAGEGRGMVKLTPEQQAEYVRGKPDVFQPVNGAWGRQGCTFVRLAAATARTAGAALRDARANAAAKREPQRPRRGNTR